MMFTFAAAAAAGLMNLVIIHSRSPGTRIRRLSPDTVPRLAALAPALAAVAAVAVAPPMTVALVRQGSPGARVRRSPEIVAFLALLGLV